MSQRMLQQRRWAMILICFSMALGTAISAWAGENPLGLDNNMNYDIYVGGNGDSFSIIKNIDIVGFRDISGLRFLVVRAGDFSSRKSEGLILLDFVRAILPTQAVIPLSHSNKIKVENVP